MNIESLVTQMSDTGIENDTLLSVLNSFFETGTINVRRLCLSTDKKVKNIKALNQVDKSKKSLRYMAEHYGIPSVTEKLKELDGRKFTDSEVESEM